MSQGALAAVPVAGPWSNGLLLPGLHLAGLRPVSRPSKVFWRHKCKAKHVLGDINGFWELAFAGLPRLVQGGSQALPAPTQKPFGDINVKQNMYLET